MKIDLMVLFMTFLAGVLAGSFIYFTGFREIDVDPVNPSTVSEYEIVVTEYGGCSMGDGCRSYRLASDGTLLFIEASGDVLEFELTERQQETLTEALVAADLEAQAAPIEPDFCESWVDGVDIEYAITRESTYYLLDTCTTATDVDDTLIEFLDDVFSDMASA